nr:DUF4097 family beta strand repeat-containing protein [uncultured Carboxylicivirga sp.]
MQKVLLFALLMIIATLGKAQEVTINQSFDNVTDVVINTISSDIDITSTSGNSVQVEGYIRYSQAKEQYEIEAYMKGTTLYVSVKYPKRSRGNVSGKFNLTMPSMTDVDINTVSGNVVIKGIGQKMVKVNTVSGDLYAEKIGSDMKGSTVSGDIEITDIKGNLKLSSVSGDQSITDVDGNFNGSSISGDFRITNLKGNKNISTISGSVR